MCRLAHSERRGLTINRDNNVIFSNGLIYVSIIMQPNYKVNTKLIPDPNLNLDDYAIAHNAAFDAGKSTFLYVINP